MNETIRKIIDGIIDIEGEKYTNDPADSGGPTKFGVTQQAYSEYVGRQVTEEEIEALTRAQAFEFFAARYVHSPGFDGIAEASDLVGAEVIDSGVNCGVITAGKWLQRCLNALNRQQKDYPDLVVDGCCGAKTLTAMKSLLAVRGSLGERVLWRYLNALQGAYYIELAERREKDEKFIFGWGLQRLGRVL